MLQIYTKLKKNFGLGMDPLPVKIAYVPSDYTNLELFE